MSEKERTPTQEPEKVTFDADVWIPVAQNVSEMLLFVRLSPPDKDGLSNVELRGQGKSSNEAAVSPLAEMYEELALAVRMADGQGRRLKQLEHALDVIVSNMDDSEVAMTLAAIDPAETTARAALARQLRAIHDKKRSKAEAMSDEELRSVVQDADVDDMLKSAAEDELKRREADQQDEND